MVEQQREFKIIKSKKQVKSSVRIINQLEINENLSLYQFILNECVDYYHNCLIIDAIFYKNNDY